MATLYSPELAAAQKEFLEASAMRLLQPDLYQAALQRLRLWKLTTTQIEEIERSGIVRHHVDLLAERDGTVLRRRVSQGDYVGMGSVLYDVADLGRLWVMLDAYESDLTFLSLGDEVRFTVAGLSGETFQSQISFIDPLIDPVSRTATVRAEIPNDSGTLRPGMLVRANLSVSIPTPGRDARPSPGLGAGVEERMVAIPRTALLWSGRRSIVYVKVPGSDVPSFEMRDVIIGPSLGDLWMVISGLEVGEEIVTHGVFAVDAAAQLSGQTSMMNRDAEGTSQSAHLHAQAQEPGHDPMHAIQMRRQITVVADAYIKLKNSLVEDDDSAALLAIDDIRDTLEKVDWSIIGGEDRSLWQEWRVDMVEALTNMSDKGDLKTMRLHFSNLSNLVIEAADAYGLDKQIVYKAFCPMAAGNRGAYWLSETPEIRNPYFGPAMLACGEVSKTYVGSAINP